MFRASSFLFLVQCSLFVVCGLLFVCLFDGLLVCLCLFVVRCVLIVVRCLLFGARCVLFVACWCLMLVACCFAVCRFFFPHFCVCS